MEDNLTQSIELNHKFSQSLKSQADTVLYFIERLDIEMVDAFLDNKKTYQDFEKSKFIKKFGIAFDEFNNAGDTFLNKYPGFCGSELCNHKCKGFRFIGNYSMNYFDLIIDIKDGVIQDIYECSQFENITSNISKAKQIEIDKQEYPF